MNKLKVVLLLFVIGLAIGGGVAYYLWNMPHKNVAEAKAFKTLTADALFQDVKGKDSASLAKYRDEVFQVNGKIDRIESPKDTVINIFLSVGGGGSDNISCAMDPQFFNRLQNLKAGDTITIKGLYSGLNKFEDKDLGISTLDVDLARCVAMRK